MDLQLWHRLEFAAATHFRNFTGYDCDRAICELLIDGARDYLEYNKAGEFHRAEMALEATVGYVNTELSEEEYEQYTESFEDVITAVLDGCYDDEIDLENGIQWPEEDEPETEDEEPGDWRLGVNWGSEEMPALV